jgi:hypothetical protein
VSTQGSVNDLQYVSGVSISTIVPVEWKVIAHEMGHNFGSEHDCAVGDCPCTSPDLHCGCIACSPICDCKGQYSIPFLNIVMHPLDNAVTDDFSPGTIERVCELISTKRLTSCLKGLFR